MSRGIDIIGMWVKKSNKANRIINSEKRETSISFGVGTIFISIFLFLFGVLFAIGLSGITNNSFNDKYIVDILNNFVIYSGNILIAILFAIVGGLCVIVLFINGILNIFYQLKINKKAIGYVGLVLFIISVIATVILILQLF